MKPRASILAAQKSMRARNAVPRRGRPVGSRQKRDALSALRFWMVQQLQARSPSEVAYMIRHDLQIDPAKIREWLRDQYPVLEVEN